MATETDVFYGFCTFWTGDWAWLRARNGQGDAALERGAGVLPGELAKAFEEIGVRITGRAPRAVGPHKIPQCPFCGSVGFETSREGWLQSIREWDRGTSPKAPGVTHSGYEAMVLWGEKQCFKDYAALELSWREQTPEGRAAPAWPPAPGA